MAEYIEREALLKNRYNIYVGFLGSVPVVNVKDIDNAPAADVAPVVHGRWEKEPPYISVGGEYKKALICSQCHSFFVSDGNKPWQMHNYCPNCGARMDGGNRVSERQ